MRYNENTPFQTTSTFPGPPSTRFVAPLKSRAKKQRLSLPPADSTAGGDPAGAPSAKAAAIAVAAAATPQPIPPLRSIDWPTSCVAALLAIAVPAVFGQTVRYDFVNFDDDQYVYENPDVTAGLTLARDRLGLHPLPRTSTGIRSPGSPTCWTASSTASRPAGTT